MVAQPLSRGRRRRYEVVGPVRVTHEEPPCPGMEVGEHLGQRVFDSRGQLDGPQALLEAPLPVEVVEVRLAGADQSTHLQGHVAFPFGDVQGTVQSLLGAVVVPLLLGQHPAVDREKAPRLERIGRHKVQGAGDKLGHSCGMPGRRREGVLRHGHGQLRVTGLGVVVEGAAQAGHRLLETVQGERGYLGAAQAEQDRGGLGVHRLALLARQRPFKVGQRLLIGVGVQRTLARQE